MRSVEIKQGSVDVRIRESTGEVVLVFEAADASMKFWRLMTTSEARAFAEFIQERVGKGSEG